MTQPTEHNIFNFSFAYCTVLVRVKTWCGIF